jgi:hypothetical protein
MSTPSRSPYGFGSENGHGRKHSDVLRTTIADKYLASLSSPLSARTPGRLNAEPPTMLLPDATTSRSPSPTKHFFDSNDDISVMRASSTVHFRNLATNKDADISEGTLHIPGITEGTEDVAGESIWCFFICLGCFNG